MFCHFSGKTSVIIYSMKNKQPLWLELSLLSIIPLVIVFLSFLFFVHTQYNYSEKSIQTQKLIFNISNNLELLRIKIRSANNSIDLKEILKDLDDYNKIVLSSQLHFSDLDTERQKLFQNSTKLFTENIKLFEKYNNSGLNFELENKSINDNITSSLVSLEVLSRKNQNNAEIESKRILVKFLLLTFIIMISTLYIIFKKISLIVQAINKINETFISSGDKYHGLENEQVFSGITELDDIYHSSITSSNEIYKRKNELIAKSRLAAMGETAAHIAHEILTPLTVIKMNSVRISRAEDVELSKFGQTNLKMIERISKIISSTKKGAYLNDNEDFQEICLSNLLEELSILISIRINNQNIGFEIIGDTQIKFQGREGQLLQVLVNLVNNSIDAIQDHKDKWIKIKIIKRENIFNIAIEDSGDGIDPKILDKLFGSFYTTKKNGNGTGIGLNLSRKIIEGHSGQLNYDKSSVHTQFVISLPVLAS